jgi:beta-N-acetylhexosaminidase
MNPDIGQLLIIGFEPAEMTTGVASLLKRIQPAGVILFGRNIQSAGQTHGLLQKCRALVSPPMFTCVDLEGGRVDRFRSVFGSAPSAAEVFATGHRMLFRKHGKVIGQACRSLGFNTDFAPVLDLALEASRTVMSSRAVSADPRQVVVYAREFLAGLNASGVLGCGKHFPGLGEADLDTHHELPSVAASYKKLWAQDIYPYRVMRRELPMVLISHANYAAVTHDSTPASLSKKWITDVLRKKIGYRGLIVSDDMEMGGVLKAASIGQATVEFIRAGGDLCLVCRQEDLVASAYEALIKETERNRPFARRVKESAAKVRRFKSKSAEIRRRGAAVTPARVEKLSRQLWEFGEEVRMEIIERQEQS